MQHQKQAQKPRKWKGHIAKFQLQEEVEKTLLQYNEAKAKWPVFEKQNYNTKIRTQNSNAAYIIRNTHQTKQKHFQIKIKNLSDSSDLEMKLAEE